MHLNNSPTAEIHDISFESVTSLTNGSPQQDSAAIEMVNHLSDVGTVNQSNSKDDRRIVLVGCTGVGKSGVGNSLLGGEKFKVATSADSVTTKCEQKSEVLKKRMITVVDTPGFFDTRFSNEETQTEVGACVAFSSPGPHAILLVLRVGRFTEQDQKAVKIIQDLFGKGAEKYTIILFTRKDDLEEESIDTYIEKSKDLKSLIAKYGNRYCAINNKASREEMEQARSEIIAMIDRMVEDNNGSFYTNEMFQEAEKVIQKVMAIGQKDSSGKKSTEESDGHWQLSKLMAMSEKLDQLNEPRFASPRGMYQVAEISHNSGETNSFEIMEGTEFGCSQTEAMINREKEDTMKLEIRHRHGNKTLQIIQSDRSRKQAQGEGENSSSIVQKVREKAEEVVVKAWRFFGKVVGGILGAVAGGVAGGKAAASNVGWDSGKCEVIDIGLKLIAAVLAVPVGIVAGCVSGSKTGYDQGGFKGGVEGWHKGLDIGKAIGEYAGKTVTSLHVTEQFKQFSKFLTF